MVKAPELARDATWRGEQQGPGGRMTTNKVNVGAAWRFVWCIDRTSKKRELRVCARGGGGEQDQEREEDTIMYLGARAGCSNTRLNQDVASKGGSCANTQRMRQREDRGRCKCNTGRGAVTKKRKT